MANRGVVYLFGERGVLPYRLIFCGLIPGRHPGPHPQYQRYRQSVHARHRRHALRQRSHHAHLLLARRFVRIVSIGGI